MDPNETTLTASMNIEWLNAQGIIQRKANSKNALLRLVRNEFRDIYIEITSEKSVPIKLHLKGINVHKKFMSEGKASIRFQDAKCTLFISNAPPAQLFNFLRTMFVKMTGEKDNNQSTKTSLRERLLSGKTKSFEDISPVTVTDLNKAKAKVSKSSVTTPSPPANKKRKLMDRTDKPTVSKKLYSSSTIVPMIDLNPEQKEVLDACLAGNNVFFTGSAGTGKSFLLRKIIAALPPDVTTATASTGVAACHIGGVTLHAFAGIGTGDAVLERCFELASRPASAQIWRKCKHLIIDEISMVDGKFFEKIEQVARFVRKNDKPFGGIQLILCGDFFQLPPVIKQFGASFSQNTQKQIRFCFQTSAWEKCIHRSFELQRVHRQKDPQFVSILNSIRIGHITDEIVDKLMATSKQTIEEGGILATRLCSHTNDANLINESKLKSLPGEIKTFKALDSDPSITKQLDQQTSVPGKLDLKIGAQVMLLKNVNVTNGLVNGARGIVVNFVDNLPVVRFRNNKEYTAKHERWSIKTVGGGIISRKQVPLKLAWAFSIHKSQGLTLDCVEMSLSRVFEAGQAYVALSRAQSLKTLRIVDFNRNQVWANPDVLNYYKRLRRRMEQTRIIPLGRK